MVSLAPCIPLSVRKIYVKEINMSDAVIITMIICGTLVILSFMGHGAKKNSGVNVYHAKKGHPSPADVMRDTRPYKESIMKG